MDEQQFKIFWDEALKQIEEQYKINGKTDDFKLWFNMNFVKSSGTDITVSVPSPFMWNMQVNKGFVSEIENKIEELCGQKVKLTSIVSKPKNTNEQKIQNSENSQIKTNQNNIKNNSVNLNSQKISEEFQTEQITQSIQETNLKKVKKHPLLDEKFTFENFVKGDNNEFAYSAALAAAKNPGKAYSPLLFYGGVGLGKTHLMQAVGNYIYNNSPSNTKICYISAEEFANEFTKSLRDNQQEQFKLKYRGLDVLLLDDIHFLIGKKGIQEEIFFTFEALYRKHSQMIFTCDRPLSELKGIEERLMSRFSLGTPIDLAPPNYETRCAILQKKALSYKTKISDEVIEYIAKTIQSNVRDLESSLKIIINYADLIPDQKIDIEMVQKLLKDTFTQTSNDSIRIDTIQKVIADHYNISISDIKSKKRNKKFVTPRNIAIYIGRELCDYSFPCLGEEFGGRDHSTIMHSYDNVVDQIKVDSSLNNTIQLLIREIKEYKKY